MSSTSILSDAIKENISILDYAQRLGFTPERAGNQYTLKEHDSVRIDAERNIYYRHSTEHGGSVIDFCMEFEGVTRDEAFKRLRACLTPGARARPVSPEFTAPPPHEKKIELPKAIEGPYSRVFAYLNKSRGIDAGIVSEMVKRKHLFEDEKHNCVFVGFNEKQEPAFGCVRGTNTQTEHPYRGDCRDSDKHYGWQIDNKASSLFVTEAPIDAMSIMTLLKANGRDHRKYSYLALGGVATLALEHLFESDRGSKIGRVYLATDNDAAGATAREKLREVLSRIGFKGKVIDKVPVGKDWNDDLRSFLGNRQDTDPKHTQSKISQPMTKEKERGISYEQGA